MIIDFSSSVLNVQGVFYGMSDRKHGHGRKVWVMVITHNF